MSGRRRHDTRRQAAQQYDWSSFASICGVVDVVADEPIAFARKLQRNRANRQQAHEQVRPDWPGMRMTVTLIAAVNDLRAAGQHRAALIALSPAVGASRLTPGSRESVDRRARLARLIPGAPWTRGGESARRRSAISEHPMRFFLSCLVRTSIDPRRLSGATRRTTNGANATAAVRSPDGLVAPRRYRCAGVEGSGQVRVVRVQRRAGTGQPRRRATVRGAHDYPPST